jgi:site-specific DNA recombinase
MASDRSAVAYCRVSTLEQKREGYGIDIQIRDVRAFAQRQGLLVVRFYKDEAESGAKEDRTQLRRLLQDCRRGRVQRVILPSLDRLSRDVRIAENLFHDFATLGVDVLIADMPTYNGRDRKDVLVRQIREAIAEENRKEIIERLWKGRQERIRRGLPPGGNAPYGYKRVDRTLVPDPVEAAVVKIVFTLARRGSTPTAIARTLVRRGFERRNGRPWTRRRVASVLARWELYRHGLIRYGEVKGTQRNLVLLHGVGGENGARSATS